MSELSAEQSDAAAVTRLNALSPLDHDAMAALRTAAGRPRKFRSGRELLAERQEITETLLILDGWAARQRILEDGRRQIVEFLLPGDLIGSCDYTRPVVSVPVVALTEVVACVAPDPGISASLSRAYALSRALGEVRLAAQITRLGRMNAQDRIVDLLLELSERLAAAGLATRTRFMLPLTQELIADAIGLTTVHVNRTLQTLRQAGALTLKGRELIIPNPNTLRQSIGRQPMRITAGDIDPVGG